MMKKRLGVYLDILITAVLLLLSGSVAAHENTLSPRQSARAKVIEFYAPGCLPCFQLDPILARIKRKYANRVDVLRINVDETAAQPLIKEYSVAAVPTVVFETANGDRSVIVGYQGEENIE